ncbi:molybdate ABC transporter substrate-binding protein [Oceaniglobus trochenteri]|uniref:molybdate ABC transporter substrate-binding protein n=1 Tax=Oceaniglobus trochenteri TaxID=2763260 RepID=UPI001CFFCAF0
MRRALLILSLMIAGQVARAETVTVAVAANLLSTAQGLVAAYEADHPHRVELVHGSTGKLYAQIRAGAPFDIFLAADAERPELLEQEGLTAARRAYALGLIALVTAPGLANDAATLDSVRLSIADPKVAPYGRAAEQALRHLGVDTGTARLILGESVGQVAVFFATGNVDAAVISVSQLAQVRAERALDVHAIDQATFDPIRQEGVLLARSGDSPAAQSFWGWLESPVALAILDKAGYGRPDP